MQTQADAAEVTGRLTRCQGPDRVRPRSALYPARERRVMIHRSLPLVLVLAALAAPALAQAGPTAATRADTTGRSTRRGAITCSPFRSTSGTPWSIPSADSPSGSSTNRCRRGSSICSPTRRRTFGVFPYGALGGETGTAAGFTMFHSDLFGREKGLSASLVANRDNYSGGRLVRGPGHRRRVPGTGMPLSKP